LGELEREVKELRLANEILKAASAFLRAWARPATTEVVAFIDAHRTRFGVEPIYRVLSEHGVKIAPNTYWVARKPDFRDIRTPSVAVIAWSTLLKRRVARPAHGL